MEQCYALVPEPYSFFPRNCKMAVVGKHDGLPHCKRHSPEARYKREAAASERFEAQLEQDRAPLDELSRLRATNAKLLEALEEIDATLSSRRVGKAMQALTVARVAIKEAKERPR